MVGWANALLAQHSAQTAPTNGSDHGFARYNLIPGTLFLALLTC